MENRNILLFYEIEDLYGNQLAVFYDDKTLETYDKNGKNKYTLYFRYKLPINEMMSFCCDTKSLHIYEKLNDNYQLIRFNYLSKFR